MTRRGWHGESARHSLAARGCRTPSKSHDGHLVSLNRKKSNFNIVSVGDMDLYFSYDTVVAYRDPKDGLVVSENVWSKTTGKHLNEIDPDKKNRVGNLAFGQMLDDAMRRHKYLQFAPNKSTLSKKEAKELSRLMKEGATSLPKLERRLKLETKADPKELAKAFQRAGFPPEEYG